MSKNKPLDPDDFAPPRSQQYLSQGFVCQLAGISYGQLLVLMEDAELKFSRVDDGIGFLLVEDAEKMLAKCCDVRRDISATVKAARFN